MFRIKGFWNIKKLLVTTENYELQKYSEFRCEKPRNDNFKIDCGNYALFFPSNDNYDHSVLNFPCHVTTSIFFLDMNFYL